MGVTCRPALPAGWIAPLRSTYVSFGLDWCLRGQQLSSLAGSPTPGMPA